MASVIINVDDKPVKEKIICYFTKSLTFDNIILYKIVERYYIHPDSDGQATIQRIETEKVKEIHRGKHEAVSLKLLEYAQQNIINNLKEK